MDQSTCDLKCQCHDMKLLPIYCEDCAFPVCTKCLTTSHLKHNICDANDYVEKQRDVLMAAMHGEDSILEELRSCLISQRKTLEERKTKLFDEISSREEDVVSLVREVGKHYKSIVSDAVVELEEIIHKGEKTLENLSIDPELKAESEIDCIKLLQSYGDLRRLQREMKNPDPLNIAFETLKGISRMHVEDLFGKINVQHDHSHDNGSDEERQTEKRYPFYGKNVEKILSCTRKRKDQENQTIMHEFKLTVDTMKDFRKIVFSGENIYLHLGEKVFVSGAETSLCGELKNVSDLCGLSSGLGILAITDKRTALRVFLNNGKCMKFYQAGRSNRILAVEENASMGISMLIEYTYIEIKAYTYQGRQLYILQMDQNGQTKSISKKTEVDFQHPEETEFYLLTNIKKTHIALLCSKALYVYNQDLTSLLVYYCGSQNNQCVEFLASCACLDHEEHILVVNKTDNAVHMLDIAGKFLKIILWPEETLTNIVSISVDEDNWIWLGTSPKEDCSKILLFDYDYLKRTKRIQRALGESDEIFFEI